MFVSIHTHMHTLTRTVDHLAPFWRLGKETLLLKLWATSNHSFTRRHCSSVFMCYKIKIKIPSAFFFLSILSILSIGIFPSLLSAALEEQPLLSCHRCPALAL